MKTLITFLLLLAAMSITYSQDSGDADLPYQQIPDNPNEYSSGNIIARMIDGLGYRYYWASEGLREEDLQFKPSEDARSTLQTLEHIYGLTKTILNGSKNVPNTRSDRQELSYEELRTKTLLNLKEASDLFRGKTAEEVAEHAIIYQRGDSRSELPYWNMINGPIADAIYHTGQIVSFRRSSGNPINPKVNVLIGKTGN